MNDTFRDIDARMKSKRENCAHANRLKGLPTSTFEVAQMCLDCGQFLRVWWVAGEQKETPEPTSEYYLKIAAAKLRVLADTMEHYCES